MYPETANASAGLAGHNVHITSVGTQCNVRESKNKLG